MRKKYRVIGVEQQAWLKIKEEFNHKSRTFEYIEEPSTKLWLKESSTVANNEIEKLFGDVVEYEN